MNQPIFNPWAAPYLNGFNIPDQDLCEPVDGGFVFPETFGFFTMPGGQTPIEVNLVLDNENDFDLMCFQWALDPSQQPTPGFLWRLRDDAGNFVSDGLVYCFATPGTFANPFPIFPHIRYAAHQRIQFELTNLSAGNQGVQIMFRGPKNYRRV